MTRLTTFSRAALSLLAAGALAVLLAVLVPTGPAAAADVPIDLYAVAGTTTMPGGQVVNVWGYASTNTPATQPGGPTLVVQQGDTVHVTLHNQLGEASSLLFQGQALQPDRTGAAAGGTKTYDFVASRPGTYLYEAGLVPNAEHQVAMGLYGALVVRPVAGGQAYASTTTAYDDEAVLLLSEVDPALNNATNPAAFDMRKYAPRYFLVNGRAYPDTTPIATAPGRKVLLRYVNAGNQYHSMAVLGARQNVVALDGSPLTGGSTGGAALRASRTYVAETFGPGQTADAIVTAPAATTGGTLTVYDASLLLHNTNTAGLGGMLTQIEVSGSGTAAAGPVTSNVTFAGGTLTATVDETTTGGSNVVAARYFIDAVTGSGVAMGGTFGAVSATVTAAVSVPSGQHVVYVQGQDADLNWGVFSSVLVNGGDVVGPATTSPLLTPGRTNGSVPVAVHATGDDTSTGGSIITGAELFVGPSPGADGTGTLMTVNAAAPVASLDATIPGSLTEGTYQVWIHAKDAANNWGPAVSVMLVVDTSAPVTDNSVSVTPTPNNGTLPVNVGTPAVRVSATVSDPDSGGVQSGIAAAEGFLCTTPAVSCPVGANGTGFVVAAVDGTFNSPSEAVYSDIPLATIAQLSNGPHTIYVHAKDAAGNWGLTASTTILIDKIAPTVVSVNRLDPDLTTAASVQFLVTFSEPVIGVTSANFGLVNGAGTSGTSITSVAGAGATRTVTVSTGLGGGASIGLNLSSATGIRDDAGNALPAFGLPFVGQVYTQPTPPLYFSTVGNTNPPTVAGTADDADIYLWSGAVFSRSVDMTAIASPLPAAANVDGLDRVDATHFYVSFSGDVTIARPGPDLSVQDEDVAYYNAGTWSVYFDGTAAGLTAANLDIDAFSIVGSTLFFSTTGNTNPPGVTGTADDADIYSWNGAAFSRAVDVSTMAAPLPGGANVDGLVRVDATHFYVSFSGDVTIARPGPDLPAQDEDVVYYNAGTWSVFFNGTARGLTSGNLDIDAFDLP